MSNWLKRHRLVSIFLAGILLATPSAVINHDLLISMALAAQKKVSELTALTGANTATDDDFLVVDTDVTASKRITRDELAIGLGGPMGVVVESAPGTAPTATGTDAISIGDGAVAGNAAGDNGVLAIGAGAVATGTDSIAIGQNTDAVGDLSIAIGGNVTDSNSADATGNNSIAIGAYSASSSLDSVAIGVAAESVAAAGIAIGRNVSASGANCIAIGGNTLSTDSADCSAADSIAIGQQVLADDIGEFAFASGEFSVQSDAHTSIYVLRNQTTDATQTELFSDGSAGDIKIASNCTTSFRINIVGRQTNATAGAGYLLVGVIDNNAGTAALIGSVVTTTIGEDVGSWDVTATADMGGSIDVLVTGAAGDNINWVARAEVVESCG